jgi:hypothetical protein
MRVQHALYAVREGIVGRAATRYRSAVHLQAVFEWLPALGKKK